MREKTKKITFLLFFQGKIYYTIRGLYPYCIPGAGTWCFPAPGLFREEAACFGAATDEKYGLPTAICMVVGIVIGSGIFFKAEKILNATGGDLRTGILAWIIGGLIAISNACAFAVMATRYQKVGGMVDYAEAAVGRAYGYYLGWFLAAVYYPCLTSTLAWVSARYTCVLLGYDIVSGECMTITLFYLVAAYFINTMAPRLAGKLQVSMTLIKLVPILLMAGMGTAAGLRSGMTAANFAQVTADTVTAYPLFTALAATAFAYEGWVVATTINAELKDPKRTPAPGPGLRGGHHHADLSVLLCGHRRSSPQRRHDGERGAWRKAGFLHYLWPGWGHHTVCLCAHLLPGHLQAG